MKSLKKKKKWLYGGSALLILLTIGGRMLSRPSDNVSAGETDQMGKVIIDKDTDKEYEVLPDASEKVESDIPEGYVQGNKPLYRFKKNSIKGYAEQYYDDPNKYSQTYYQGEEEISGKGVAILTWGYGFAMRFAGTAAILTDENQDIVKLNDGEEAIIKSSPKKSEGAHTYTGLGKLYKYDDGSYGLLSGPYILPGLYSTKFDNSFNQLEPTTPLPLTGLPLPKLAPSGIFEEDGKYFFQVSGENGSTSNFREVFQVNSTTLSVESMKKFEVPDYTNFYTSTYKIESQLGISNPVFPNAYVKRPDGYLSQAMWNTPTTSTSSIVKWKNEENEVVEMEYWAMGAHKLTGYSYAAVVKELSDENNYYYWTDGDYDPESKLMKIDLNNPGEIDPVTKEIQPEVVKVLPKQSSLQLQYEADSDTYFFQGTITQSTKELEALGIKIPANQSSLVVGQMDLDFNIISAQIIPTEKGSVTSFKKFDFDKQNPRIVKVAGDTSSITLLDEEYAAKYQNKRWDNAKQLAFWGEMELYKNHAPGLSVSPFITVNKDEMPSDTAYDTALLESVKVRDIIDEEENTTVADLKKRVNRNPKDLTAPIDWQALGLDKQTRGQYLTKYFVTDKTLLQTATSTRVNVVDNHTTKDKVGALGADNITIPVKSTDQLKWDADFSSEYHVGTRASLTAWLLDVANSDESQDTAKLTVDQDELTVINQVKAKYDAEPDPLKKRKWLKPYPLTFHYEYDKGKTLSRKIWVFVTIENTTVANDVAIYANDYELALFDAQDTTADKQLKAGWSPLRGTSPDVLVYDYKAQPQTVNELTPITVGKTEGSVKGLGMEAESLSAIQSAQTAMILPNTTFTYTDSKGRTTPVEVTATLTDPFLTVHLQQVVLSPNKGVVVPEEGSAVVSNVNGLTESGITATASRVNVTSPSQVSDFTTYSSTKVAMSYGYWAFKLTPMVPEYYQYEGYVVTETEVAHQASAKQSGYPVLEGINHREYWVTLYLSPSLSKSESPQFYGWGYGNDKDYQVSP